MTTETDAILALIARKAEVRLHAGNYRGLDGLGVLVDFDEGRVPAHSATAYRPEMNEPVWVAVIDGVPYMLGPTVPKPGDGTIVSTGSGIAEVSTDIGTVKATYLSGASLSGGQQVKLYWSNGCHVLGVKSATPTGGTAPPPPTSAGNRVTRTFTAIDSGSHQVGVGWRTNDVWCSASNRGAWFYGTKIRDTIPDSATIVSAKVFLPPPLKSPLGIRPFGRHAYTTKPGGAPTISATSTLPGVSGWVSIPTSLINNLKANTGGLGFDLGGYHIWPGTQKDGQSGAVRVTYDT